MSLRDGLVAEYFFRGNAEDSSGHGRHGDEIVVSPPPVTGNALSVSAWARFDRRDLSKGEWSNCIIAQDDGNDEDQSRRVFQLSAHGRHLVWHRMVCSRDPECKLRIRFGEWYHVVARVGDGCHTLYVDGIPQDAVDGDLRSHPEQPLHIGRKGTAEKHFFFRGAIDDVRIYARTFFDSARSDLGPLGTARRQLPRPPVRRPPARGRRAALQDGGAAPVCHRGHARRGRGDRHRRLRRLVGQLLPDEERRPVATGGGTSPLIWGAMVPGWLHCPCLAWRSAHESMHLDPASHDGYSLDDIRPANPPAIP